MYKEVEREVEKYIANNGKDKLEDKIFAVCKNQPEYVRRNLLLKYVWDVPHPATFAEQMLDKIIDRQVRSQTEFLLLSGLEKLDNEKVNFLQKFIYINLHNVKTALKTGLELNVQDILSFSYDQIDDTYSYKPSKFWQVLGNEIISNIEDDKEINIKRLQNVRDVFRNNSHLLNFESIVDPLTSQHYFKENSQNGVDYKKLEKEYYDERWKDATSSNAKQEIICERYFNEKLDTVEELINKINFSKIKGKIRGFKVIRAVLESEEYDMLYKSMNSSFRKLYRDMNFEYTAYCCNDIASSLKKYEKTCKRIRKRDVNVYSLTNEDFTLLIHRTNAFVNRSVEADVNFDKMPIEDGRAIISCSLITDLYLGKVFEEEEGSGVYFGFNSIEAKDIVDMGTKDIFSSELIGNNVPMSSYGNNFYDTENLILNSLDQYNEICIFREDQITGERIKPDYIVCFDKVNNYSKEIAEKLNIPIYFINTNMTYANGREKLRAMVKDNKNFEDAEANLKLLKRMIVFAYGAFEKEKYELDKDLLYEFLIKTRNSKSFSKNYIDKITMYAIRLNKALGIQNGYNPDLIMEVFEQ